MLNQKQMLMIQEMIYTDKTNEQIMAENGIPSTTYYRWKRDPEFIKEMDKEQNRFLKQLAQKAMRRLNGLMNSDKENIAVQASKILIDKGVPTKQEVDVTTSDGITINIGYEDKP